MADETKDPVVTLLPQPDPDEMGAGFEKMKRLWINMRKNADEIAKTKRRMFDAYRKAGFSEGDALELVKSLAL